MGGISIQLYDDIYLKWGTILLSEFSSLLQHCPIKNLLLTLTYNYYYYYLGFYWYLLWMFKIRLTRECRDKIIMLNY
jgi:hypothetical protein